MSENLFSQEWTRPDDLLKIQRLKKKQKALQERLNRPNKSLNSPVLVESSSDGFGDASFQKRKNPFFKNTEQTVKKIRRDLDNTSDDTIFQLLSSTKIQSAPNLEAPVLEERPVFESTSNQNFQHAEDDESIDPEEEFPQKHFPNLPVDWSIKNKIRILSTTQIPGNNLKTSQEASGLTGFVRCLDIKKTSSGLDISPGARFHQCLMYWQYPHLPWLNLINRNVKSNASFKIGEEESTSLLTDWTECFRNLFQLLRARQCPYFYVFANSFTVLFRAAGIGGRSEMHAFLTPTSRGLRDLLKKADIEFTMPLKTTKLNTENSEVLEKTEDPTEEDDEEDDLEPEKWLQSLGVDKKDIRLTDDLKAKKKECEDDFGDTSIVLIEGVDCQAFFNFLLNAKSTVPKVGKLAGIPPALLSPVAFLGSTLRKQSIRSSKIRVEQTDYFSMELKGVILPHTLHSLCNLMKELKDSFSCTMASFNHTVSFTKASKHMLEDSDKEKENQLIADHVFGRENLSDSGLPNQILECLCRVDENAVNLMERMCYGKDAGGFTWS